MLLFTLPTACAGDGLFSARGESADELTGLYGVQVGSLRDNTSKGDEGRE